MRTGNYNRTMSVPRRDRPDAEALLNAQLTNDITRAIDDGREYVVVRYPISEVHSRGPHVTLMASARITLLNPDDAEVGEHVHESVFTRANELSDYWMANHRVWRYTYAGWVREA